jgi:DNA mismatch repair ATPase MutS
MVSRKFIFLSSFEKLISSFGKEKFRSQILSEASGKLFSGDKSAALRIKELSQIIQSFDSRLNIFSGLILNGIILWDFQCIQRLEKWKIQTAGQLPVWLEIVGEVDALISLSNHACNNPAYVFPDILAGKPVIEAMSLGHPLIDEKIRICNDFSMSYKGLICIVTGANMAGKSTFLRTIAVNLILGMTGTTVCAGKFKFTPCILFTSMRTTDSLSNNESYFYAELKRLKILKERLDSGADLFFILDEILKGTNSEDKSTGSKLYLTKLALRSGTGIIATHDISLGEMEKDFPGKIFNKCFEVEIDGESVLFDYKLRDGITQHMNAGILMRQMGII